MIAAGWNVKDTIGKGGRGALPPEVVEVEKIVGLFQTEQASRTLWTAAEFNEFSSRALTEAEIQNVRTLRAAIFRKWFAVQPGEKLELEFESAWPRKFCVQAEGALFSSGCGNAARVFRLTWDGSRLRR